MGRTYIMQIYKTCLGTEHEIQPFLRSTMKCEMKFLETSSLSNCIQRYLMLFTSSYILQNTKIQNVQNNYTNIFVEVHNIKWRHT